MEGKRLPVDSLIDSRFAESWDVFLTQYERRDLRSHTDIPALKELEEWFDSQKEMRGKAKLDPFFERTSKLASRRLKREIERRGTLGEFALEEEDRPHLKTIPTEESGSDLFRRDEPDAVWGSRRGRVAAKRCAWLPGSGAPLGPGKRSCD